MIRRKRGTRVSLFQDWATNSGDKKAQLVMLAFRTTTLVNQSEATFAKVASKPVSVLYRVVIDWLLGVEIPWGTSIGPNLRLQHAQSIVINREAILGAGVSLHQGVTLGGRASGHDCPTLGDGVRVGAGAIIIGSVHVGDGANVGAGAVLLQDVPAGASAVGNPARIIGT